MIVQLDHVSYSYGSRLALDDLSVEMTSGVYGLLGPNGAGKTTLMKVLTGELTGTGTTSVMGGPVAGRLGQIGYLPQHFEVMGASSVLRNVEYAAWARGVEPRRCRAAALEALARVDLADRQGDRANSLSGGMRQRLGIACVIAHQPKILALDEPTVGLDPVQRSALRELIADIGTQATVLISTHLVEDLTSIAKEILVLNSGRLVFTGTPAELTELGVQRPAATGDSPAEAGYRAVLSS